MNGSVAQKTRWTICAVTVGLLLLTLLIPDGWPRTVLIGGIVVAWYFAVRRFATSAAS